MRVLVVTAVPAERDAVTRAFGAGSRVREVPGGEVHRAGPFDVLAGGAGPARRRGDSSGPGHRARRRSVRTRRLGGHRRRVRPAAPVGSLVVATGIVAADLGAETPDGFVPVTGLGFGRDTFLPPEALVRDVAEATGAVPGPVLTVSTVTGSAARTAELLAAHPGAVAEAMEGFGVAEAADRFGVPALELRAVSNTVGPRDREAWRIGDALAALTEAFGKTAPVVESWTRHDRLDRHRD